MNREELGKKACILFKNKLFSNPLTQEELENAYQKGMPRKSELQDGKYYYGTCRNACVARWDAQKQEFTYMRTKWNSRFPETIRHPEDDDGFDIFIPVGECEPTDKETIIED